MDFNKMYETSAGYYIWNIETLDTCIEGIVLRRIFISENITKYFNKYIVSTHYLIYYKK